MKTSPRIWHGSRKGSCCLSKGAQESNSKLNVHDVYHDGTVTIDTDGDGDLKAYLDEKVSCVDFGISHGELGLTLEQ